jgi:NAD(P)-dependent dehydrogenase (short-subunit alcohol dehydrogenase family)
MPRFEPLSGPRRQPSSPLVASPLRWGPAGYRSARSWSTRSVPPEAKPSRCRWTSPTPSRSRDSCTAPAKNSNIELLVAGAGDTYFGRLHEISTDTFESQVQIHLIGANRLATAVLPGMVERQRGDLIFVGSDVALRQRPHMGAYGAAKAALVAMVTNLQMELEGSGVRASIVHPGPTKTAMGWSLPAEAIGPALEDWAKWGQARHDYFLRPQDLARAIAFVAETPRGGFIANMELQPEAPLTTIKERQQLKLGPEAKPS